VLVSRNAEALMTVEQEVRALGRAVLAIPCDVALADTPAQVVSATLERFSGLDVLVNNAGINSTGSIDRVDEENWQATLDTNLTSAYRFSREAFGPMRARHWGRIINVASITAQTGGVNGSVAYSASKGGMLAMTRTLARDGAPHGITVNAVAPGQIDTGMARALDPEALRQVEAAIPLGRLGTPDDVAYAVLFLALEQAGFITGTTIDVNGGMLKR
jgi:3-oxoacyl-[acyl-carrier protein] reductase